MVRAVVTAYKPSDTSIIHGPHQHVSRPIFANAIFERNLKAGDRAVWLVHKSPSDTLASHTQGQCGCTPLIRMQMADIEIQFSVQPCDGLVRSPEA